MGYYQELLKYAFQETTTGITHVTSETFELTNNTSHTLNNIAVDDLICVHTSADIEVLSPGPTGYTELFFQRVSVDQSFHYKVATSTSETITGFNGEEGSVVVSAFRGVDTTNPIHVSDTNSGNSGTPDPPSITTTVDGCMVLALMAYDDVDITATLNIPSGYTLSDKFYETEANSTTATVYKLQSTAGSENPGTFSHSNSDPSEPWGCATIALKPTS